MESKRFEKIMENWQRMINQIIDLFDEGQKRFINASKSYFDSMKYFAEISGNIPLSNVYANLSESISKMKKKVEKK